MRRLLALLVLATTLAACGSDVIPSGDYTCFRRWEGPKLLKGNEANDLGLLEIRGSRYRFTPVGGKGDWASFSIEAINRIAFSAGLGPLFYPALNHPPKSL
jgi:hypothetical protein